MHDDFTPGLVLGFVTGFLICGCILSEFTHLISVDEWACTQPIVQEKPLEVDCAQFTRDDS